MSHRPKLAAIGLAISFAACVDPVQVRLGDEPADAAAVIADAGLPDAFATDARPIAQDASPGDSGISDRGPIDLPDSGYPVHSGSYSFSFDPTLMVTCMDALAGQEASFVSLTSAGLGFLAAPVRLSTRSSGLYLGGTPISSVFGLSEIQLMPGPTPETSNYWAGGAMGLDRAGPSGTHATDAYFAIDTSSVAAMPSLIPVQFAYDFYQTSGAGTCIVGVMGQLSFP